MLGSICRNRVSTLIWLKVSESLRPGVTWCVCICIYVRRLTETLSPFTGSHKNGFLDALKDSPARYPFCVFVLKKLRPTVSPRLSVNVCFTVHRLCFCLSLMVLVITQTVFGLQQSDSGFSTGQKFSAIHRHCHFLQCNGSCVVCLISPVPWSSCSSLPKQLVCLPLSLSPPLCLALSVSWFSGSLILSDSTEMCEEEWRGCEWQVCPTDRCQVSVRASAATNTLTQDGCAKPVLGWKPSCILHKIHHHYSQISDMSVLSKQLSFWFRYRPIAMYAGVCSTTCAAVSRWQ